VWLPTGSALPYLMTKFDCEAASIERGRQAKRGGGEVSKALIIKQAQRVNVLRLSLEGGFTNSRHCVS